MRPLIVFAAIFSAASPALAEKPKAKPAETKPAAKPPTGADGKAPAAPLPAKEVVARMQKFYESTIDLHAKFEQEMTSAIRGTKKFSGEVWLKKPGRMRWDYQKPEKKLMVADGTSLWIYEPEDDQAIRQSLKESTLPTSVTFLFGTGKLTDEFDVTEEHPPATATPAPGTTPASVAPPVLGRPGDVVLKLVPKKPTAQYRYLLFVVDGQRFMVRESYVYDQQDGVNHMLFRDLETNKGVTNARFEFSPPPGTKVIHP